MSSQGDSRVNGQVQQGGAVDLDAQYHEIGIPAVNAATHATRRQQQQKDYTTQQQSAPLFYYED